MISINLESHVKNPVLNAAVFALFFTFYAPNLRFFSSLMSKRLCSISPLPTGPFHKFEHKKAKKMIRISFHFENPRSQGTKIPDLPAPVLSAPGFLLPVFGSWGVGEGTNPRFMEVFSGFSYCHTPVLPCCRLLFAVRRSQFAVSPCCRSPFAVRSLPFRLVAVCCLPFAVCRFALLLFAVCCSLFSVLSSQKGVYMKIKNFPGYPGPKSSHPVSASRGFYDDQFDLLELESLSHMKESNLREEINVLRVLVRRTIKLLNRRSDDPHIIKDYVAISKICAQISNLRRTENVVEDDPGGKSTYIEAAAEAATNFLNIRKEES
jgi:hypothetical protein